MPTSISIYQTCRACKGTGIDRHTTGKDIEGNLIWYEGPCVACSGTGEIVWGTLRDGTLDDIMDKLNDIKEKVDEIKEVVDAL